MVMWLNVMRHLRGSKAISMMVILRLNWLDALFLRDKNLVEDVIGKMSFTDAMFYHIVGTPPPVAKQQYLTLCL